MKFPSKAEQGILPKELPIQSQTHFVSQNQSMTLSPNPNQNFPKRNFPVRIRWRSTILLRERHTRIFRGGCSHRAIHAKHVPSFTPVAQHHLFHKKGIPLNTTMERNFPWECRWTPSRGIDSAVSFAIPNFPIKEIFRLNFPIYLPLKTDTTSPKLEKASLTAWSLMNSGRKIVTKIGSFPFLRGPAGYLKVKTISESPERLWISVPSSFSFTVYDPRTKTNFEGETLYRAPIPVTHSDSRKR